MRCFLCFSTGAPSLLGVFRRTILLSTLLVLWLIPEVARGDAGDLYWDNVGPGSPNGVWDVSSSSWSTNPFGGGQVQWAGGSNAFFSASGLSATGNFTVTLATDVAVGNLTYTGGNLGSTLQIAAGP